MVDALKQSGAKTVLDLGCGSGKLLRALMHVPQLEQILGIDVSPRELEFAPQHLKLAELTPRQKARIRLEQGALTYRDPRLAGFDAAAIVEVIEHLDPDRISAFERVVFEHARPQTVVLTTPNREYNATFENLGPSTLRHPDHRFEWTRQEFQTWAERVAEQLGYRVTLSPIGAAHAELGAPTQMAVFTR